MPNSPSLVWSADVLKLVSELPLPGILHHKRQGGEGRKCVIGRETNRGSERRDQV